MSEIDALKSEVVRLRQKLVTDMAEATTQLAAREEELRQARENGQHWVQRSDGLAVELAKVLDAWSNANSEIASLRAALVEAQSKLSDRQEDLNHAREAIRSLKEGNDSLSSALVEAQEIGARKDEALKKAEIASKNVGSEWEYGDLTFGIMHLRCVIEEALALTQTPNLYRELTAENEGLKESLKVAKAHLYDITKIRAGAVPTR
jgi:chromosome segregation ATPase